MPLPEDHLRSLSNSVQGHERQIAELRARVHDADEAIAMHEVLLHALQDEQVLGAFERFYDTPDALERFTKEPHDFIRSEGIALPEGLIVNGVELRTEPVPRLTVHMGFGVWNVEFVWNRDLGFDGSVRRSADSPFGPVTVSS